MTWYFRCWFYHYHESVTIFRYDWNSVRFHWERNECGQKGYSLPVQSIRITSQTLSKSSFQNGIVHSPFDSTRLSFFFCYAAKCRFCSVATCSRINLAHVMWFESKCNHRVMSQELLSISLHSISLVSGRFFCFFSRLCIIISRWKLLRASLVPHVCRNVAGKRVKSCNINIETTACRAHDRIACIAPFCVFG